MTEFEPNQYPIGKFELPQTISDADVEDMISEIKTFPAKFSEAVATLSDDQLDTPYRTGGWTVRQLVHHVADSHLNAFLRIKLALTEEQTTIKPYNEKMFAELPDSRRMPIKPALLILEGLHARWAFLVKSLTNRQLERTFYHPADEQVQTIREALARYVWHGSHHLAQIKNLKKERGW